MMYSDIPIWLAISFVVAGLYVLTWSADRFVGGAETVARSLGVSPFRDVSPHVIMRDFPVMVLLSLSIAMFGCRFRNVRAEGVITRVCGIVWLVSFAAYLALVVHQEALSK